MPLFGCCMRACKAHSPKGCTAIGEVRIRPRTTLLHNSPVEFVSRLGSETSYIHTKYTRHGSYFWKVYPFSVCAFRFSACIENALPEEYLIALVLASALTPSLRLELRQKRPSSSYRQSQEEEEINGSHSSSVVLALWLWWLVFPFLTLFLALLTIK